MIGNVWEYTSDNYCPLRGYKINDYFPTYSANNFDTKHITIKGNSWMSSGNRVIIILYRYQYIIDHIHVKIV